MCGFEDLVIKSAGAMSSLSLSQITCSGDSQLTCCKDTQEALWKGPHGEDPKYLASSQEGPEASCQQPCE